MGEEQSTVFDAMVEAMESEWVGPDPNNPDLGASHAVSRGDGMARLLVAALEAAPPVTTVRTLLREAKPTPKVKVILFKPSGKYYTQEEWVIPTEVPDFSQERGHYTREVLIPADMRHSSDFRRIDGGAVLVEEQEPWGYPHLFPAETPTIGQFYAEDAQ